MGEIVSEFTCVEFNIDLVCDDYTTYDDAAEATQIKLEGIKAVIDCCEFKDNFNLSAGSNGCLYFTATPSGSKTGWQTNNAYKEELKELCDFIKGVSDFYIEKTVITSAG